MSDYTRYDIASGTAKPGTTVPEAPATWRPLNRRQAEALSRSEFELFVGGARGGGKSELGMMWLLEPEYVNHPDYRFLVLRKNFVDLTDWTHRFRKFASQFLPGIEVSSNSIKLPSGGLGLIGHLASRDAYEKYVGHQVQKLLVEEINLVPDEGRYLMVLGSCRSIVPELRPQCMSSGNPGGPGHAWVKKRFVDVCRDKPYTDPQSGQTRIFIPLLLKENTMLGSDYEATLRLLPKAIQAGWIHGDWEALAGQMFTQMPPLAMPYQLTDMALYGSFDFGSSETGHSSFGLWNLREDKVPERIATWYHKLGHTAGAQALELADYVKSFPWTRGKLPRRVFADPAIFAKRKEIGVDQTPKSVADYFNEAFGADPNQPIFVPANNHRVNGWRIVQDYFSEHPITKEPKCVVWEGYNNTMYDHFQLQIRDPDNPDDLADNDYDHVVDEVRYGLTAFHSMGYVEQDTEAEKPEFGSVNAYDYSYQEQAWMA
jgi:hypothetical protein